jgi:hypothetical protein
MRRREFLTLFSGTAATWPLAVSAQQKPMPVIGFLGNDPGAPGVAGFNPQGLRELGYIEGPQRRGCVMGSRLAALFGDRYDGA